MNGQNLLSPKNVKDNNLDLEDKNLVKISRSKLGYFSAITLPMILAACGGGGGGGGAGGGGARRARGGARVRARVLPVPAQPRAGGARAARPRAPRRRPPRPPPCAARPRSAWRSACARTARRP